MRYHIPFVNGQILCGYITLLSLDDNFAEEFCRKKSNKTNFRYSKWAVCHDWHDYFVYISYVLVCLKSTVELSCFMLCLSFVMLLGLQITTKYSKHLRMTKAANRSCHNSSISFRKRKCTKYTFLSLINRWVSEFCFPGGYLTKNKYLSNKHVVFFIVQHLSLIYDQVFTIALV